MLNTEYINRANAASHFDAGNSINRDAINAAARFDAEFSPEGLTPKQIAYLDERREKWRAFVLDHYNDQCRRRAEYVPVTVCGPARYPGAKMQKRVEKIMELSGEFAEKAARFFENTHKALQALKPLETQLAEIYAGERYRETIQGDDPHAIEKLEAKIAGLEHRQEQMKAANRAIRANKTPEKQSAALLAIGFSESEAQEILTPNCYGGIGFMSFELSNNNATIKTTSARLERMKAERAAPTLKGWTFEGGEVVANAEDDRLQILFNTRPDSAMIAKLKKAAFRWSPRNMAWQRQLTVNAVRAAKAVLG